MKIRNTKSIVMSALGAVAALGATFYGVERYEYAVKDSALRSALLQAQTRTEEEQAIRQWVSGALALRIPKFGETRSFADEGESIGDSSCEEIMSTARAKCQAAWMTGYTAGALKYFNGTLCYLNDEFAANIENVLCHFSKSMGLKPNLDALPVSITKDFGSMSVTLDVVKPTEAFAVAEGYEAKATVSVSGINYMVLYWKGKGTESAGYLIEGARGLSGSPRASYSRWDLTNADAQLFQLYQCEFQTTPLATASDDRCIYGRALYNSSSKAISSQVIMIEQQRGELSNSGELGCFKMFSNGIKGGRMFVAKTDSSLGSPGHDPSATATNYANLDAVAAMPDTSDTGNGVYNLTASQLEAGTDISIQVDTSVEDSAEFDVDTNNAATATMSIDALYGRTNGTNYLGTLRDSIAFDLSCNSINTASAGVFAANGGDYVDFTLAPDDALPAIE